MKDEYSWNSEKAVAMASMTGRAQPSRVYLGSSTGTSVKISDFTASAETTGAASREIMDSGSLFISSPLRSWLKEQSAGGVRLACARACLVYFKRPFSL